ncbi:MAG: aminotransferase class I/II-fold pyridoxal phosphate-dependent enzyme [Thiohalomonadaceae bacterium]
MTDTRVPRLAHRMADIESFQVMDLLARARELEGQGRDIVHMEIGEPDFPTPEPITAAARRALAEGKTHYTPALGLPALREAIAGFYRQRYGVIVSPERIVITPGASGALLLALGVLLNPGEKVLLADPGYPCNRHFVRFLDGAAQSVPVDADTAWQLAPRHIEQYWDANTVAAMVASPSNPTGTLLGREELAALAAAVAERGGTLIADEIYHGLTYPLPASPTVVGEEKTPSHAWRGRGSRATSALEITPSPSQGHESLSPSPLQGEGRGGGGIFVINSFSKYFQMTGWRLGWLVVPEGYVREVEKLAQNLFIAPSTPAQYAALAAFSDETLAILEARRAEFQRRRDYLLPALRGLGFDIPLVPQGAFYIYADCSRLAADSRQFSRDLLEQAGVAVTPGADFGRHQPGRYLRFAYTTDLSRLQEGVERIRRFLGHGA